MRSVMLSGVLFVLSCAFNLTIGKYGTNIPDWLIITCWIVPLAPLAWLGITHPKFLKRREWYMELLRKRKRSTVSATLGVIVILVISLSFAGKTVWRVIAAPRALATVDMSMTVPSSPVFDFQISKALLAASVKVNTKYMLRYKDNFYFMIILRVIDNSVESLDDARIIKSARFEITGDIRTIEIPLTEDFFDRAQQAGKLGTGNVGLNLVLIPSSVSPDQIVTLRDVTRLGGMQTTIDHGLQEKANPH